MEIVSRAAVAFVLVLALPLPTLGQGLSGSLSGSVKDEQGGTLALLCFSDEEPPGPGPHRIAQHELGDAFRGIFVVSAIRPGRFERRGQDPARAWVALLTVI